MTPLVCRELEIPGLRLLTPAKYEDERGFFSEVYNKRLWSASGVDDHFVQDNHSKSREAGTVRGLHFQTGPQATSKLIRVLRGAIFDVVVDMRHGSPTFGKHLSVELSAQDWQQLYVPVGLAHGFCTLERDAEVSYKVSAHWSPDVDRGIAWDDPVLRIDWPVPPEWAILSDKDRSWPTFDELPRYFSWEG